MKLGSIAQCGPSLLIAIATVRGKVHAEGAIAG